MQLSTIKRIQHLPIDLNKAWSFFSNPGNLQDITPKELGFTILSELPEEMYEGMIIAYNVKPVMKIPVYWVTEITHVSKLHYFIDEQRFGPYKFWHHQHFFNETNDGIQMTDIINYKLPFGWIGGIANSIFVRQQLNNIFEHRYKVLQEKFTKL